MSRPLLAGWVTADMFHATSSSPRYLLSGPGVDLASLRPELEPIGPFEVVQNVDALLGRSGDESGAEPGWILVPTDSDSGSELVLDVLRRLADREGGWSLLVLDSGPRGLGVVPVSPGFRTDVDSVAARLEAGGSDLGLLSFRHAMKELSRIRHDINNPLTAALAETQLVLMDVEPDSEAETSLRAVEEQLRRIRDLVAELTAYRVPARPPE